MARGYRTYDQNASGTTQASYGAQERAAPPERPARRPTWHPPGAAAWKQWQSEAPHFRAPPTRAPEARRPPDIDERWRATTPTPEAPPPRPSAASRLFEAPSRLTALESLAADGGSPEQRYSAPERRTERGAYQSRVRKGFLDARRGATPRRASRSS